MFKYLTDFINMSGPTLTPAWKKHTMLIELTESHSDFNLFRSGQGKQVSLLDHYSGAHQVLINYDNLGSFEQSANCHAMPPLVTGLQGQGAGCSGQALGPVRGWIGPSNNLFPLTTLN